MTTNSETKTATRADLHCHSTASAVSKLGVQRALGLPECATPPEEVYALAKRRGMDFVTITDHDTIDGALEIADRPDVFVSEELTARFARRAAGGARPLLRDHARRPRVAAGARRRRRGGRRVPARAARSRARSRTRSTRSRRRSPRATGGASPSCSASGRSATAPARPSSTRRRRSTSRRTAAPASAAPTTTPASTSAARGPRRPRPRRRREFLDHLRAGRVDAHGEQGSAAKWAHAAMAIAVRTLRPQRGRAARPRGRAADGRAGHDRRATPAAARLAADLGPDDGRALLRAWLDAIDLDLPARELLALLQADDFCHAALYRRARRFHERKLAAPRSAAVLAIASEGAGGDWGAAATEVFDGLHPRGPVRPRDRLPRPREAQARRAATASRRASRWSPTASAPRTASPARSRSCASAAFRASRSR